MRACARVCVCTIARVKIERNRKKLSIKLGKTEAPNEKSCSFESTSKRIMRTNRLKKITNKHWENNAATRNDLREPGNKFLFTQICRCSFALEYIQYTRIIFHGNKWKYHRQECAYVFISNSRTHMQRTKAPPNRKKIIMIDYTFCCSCLISPRYVAKKQAQKRMKCMTHNHVRVSEHEIV